MTLPSPWGAHSIPNHSCEKPLSDAQTKPPQVQLKTAFFSTLILSRLVIILFTVAGMELRFGFVLKTVLTMPGCFQWCWAVLSQCQGISAPDPSLPEEEGRMPQGTAGDTSRTADPNWAKKYPTPYGVLLNIYEAGEQGGRGGSFGMTTFVFPSHHLVWQSPTFLEIAEHLPALKRWINSLFSFACGCSFCFTYWTAFISTQELSQFSLSDSLPSPWQGTEKAAVWGLVASWG